MRRWKVCLWCIAVLSESCSLPTWTQSESVAAVAPRQEHFSHLLQAGQFTSITIRCKRMHRPFYWKIILRTSRNTILGIRRDYEPQRPLHCPLGLQSLKRMVLMENAGNGDNPVLFKILWLKLQVFDHPAKLHGSHGHSILQLFSRARARLCWVCPNLIAQRLGPRSLSHCYFFSRGTHAPSSAECYLIRKRAPEVLGSDVGLLLCRSRRRLQLEGHPVTTPGLANAPRSLIRRVVAAAFWLQLSTLGPGHPVLSKWQAPQTDVANWTYIALIRFRA